MTNNVEPLLLRQLNDTNELLILLIEVQLAALESYESYTYLAPRLERIKEQRSDEDRAIRLQRLAEDHQLQLDEPRRLEDAAIADYDRWRGQMREAIS